MNHQFDKSGLAADRFVAGSAEFVMNRHQTSASGWSAARVSGYRLIGGLCAATLLGAALLSSHAYAASDAAVKKTSGTAVTVTDPNRLTRSGYLSNYDRLKPIAGGGGIECWRDAGVDLKKYDKVMISRILLSLKANDGKETAVDPSDLKMLADYFNDSLVNALKPQMTVVTAPEPGTVVIAVALTSLKPTSVSRSLAGTLVPFGFVAEAGAGVAKGGPVGSTPYLGETGMEMQILDGASGAVIGECRDTSVGRKYAAEMDSSAAETWASGYMNSFQAWAYAKNAFDKWSALLAQRFAELRGAKTAK